MKLQRLIEQYIAYQQSLGTAFLTDAMILRAFGRANGARARIADIRLHQVESFLGETRPVTITWHTKFRRLRSFFQYAVSRGYLAVAPLPTTVPKRPPPFVPYIFSREELRRLFEVIDADQRNTCLKPATMHTLILLLYGAGLRLREAVDLARSDVDLNGSVLTVRETKFGKTRLVPVGQDLSQALVRYAAQARAPRSEDTFFTTRMGTRVKPDTLQHNFRILCDRAGIHRTDGALEKPRLHDLRHSFAVHRLTSWYQQGADVQRLLQHLSVYLGHVHIRHTQVYLSMTPELLHQASQRFEGYAAKKEGQRD
jgi:site-specific recombinase XerD